MAFIRVSSSRLDDGIAIPSLFTGVGSILGELAGHLSTTPFYTLATPGFPNLTKNCPPEKIRNTAVLIESYFPNFIQKTRGVLESYNPNLLLGFLIAHGNRL